MLIRGIVAQLTETDSAELVAVALASFGGIVHHWSALVEGYF